jgi:electron transport complex protein RnfG
MAIGLDLEGRIQKISFISIKESPGVGMRAQEEPGFTEQFAGKQGELTAGQDVDTLSGATITSTAVIKGVNTGLSFFEAVMKGGN